MYQHFSPKAKTAASGAPSCMAKEMLPWCASYIARIESCRYSGDLLMTKPFRSAVACISSKNVSRASSKPGSTTSTPLPDREVDVVARLALHLREKILFGGLEVYEHGGLVVEVVAGFPKTDLVQQQRFYVLLLL